MEFTRENIIKLLNEQIEFLSSLARQYQLESEDEKVACMSDYYQGKSQGFEASGRVMKDTIDLIEKYYDTTEEQIDREHSEARLS